MGKIIFWLVVFFVVLLVLRVVNATNSRSRNRDASDRRANARDTATTRCVSCGVYLPSADAIQGPRGPVCGDPKCLPKGTRDTR